MTLARGSDPSLVFAELSHVIEQAMTNDPRSLQKRIGPSEIGTECGRRLGYKLAGIPELGCGDPPWLATVGRAVHDWLEGTFMLDNARIMAAGNPQRWYLEERVTVGSINGEDIDGSTDLYDSWTCGVWDWKIPGPTRMKKYRKGDVGGQYRVQCHSYGRGWVAKGFPVDYVGIAFLPRSEPWKKRFHWVEAYDEQVATDALGRANGIATALRLLPPEQALGALPTDPDLCTWCPWFKPGSTDLRQGCPGDESRVARRGSLHDLIA